MATLHAPYFNLHSLSHFKAEYRMSCIKSGGKSQFSLSFISYTVNDVRRKLYMVGIQPNVEKRAKRMPDTTVETNLLHRIVTVPFSTLVQLLLQWNSIFILLSHKHLTIRSEWANFKDKTQNIIISLIFSLTGLQKCHNITQQHNVGFGSYFGFDIKN